MDGMNRSPTFGSDSAGLVESLETHEIIEDVFFFRSHDVPHCLTASTRTSYLAS